MSSATSMRALKMTRSVEKDLSRVTRDRLPPPFAGLFIIRAETARISQGLFSRTLSDDRVIKAIAAVGFVKMIGKFQGQFPGTLGKGRFIRPGIFRI